MTLSNLIRGAWYQPDRRRLDLLLWNGRRYVYSGVPPSVAQGFAAADSKGRFFNAEIRNCFPCREVEPERSAA